MTNWLVVPAMKLVVQADAVMFAVVHDVVYCGSNESCVRVVWERGVLSRFRPGPTSTVLRCSRPSMITELKFSILPRRGIRHSSRKC